jgi:hypothetical protein
VKLQRFCLAMTLFNAAILIAAVTTRRSAAEEIAPVLRARALEIVDSQGRVRASLAVLNDRSAGEARGTETVLLRLITERGRPSVKISASEEASGLSFAGPTGTQSTYVILEAKGATTALRLKNEDGSERIVKPE